MQKTISQENLMRIFNILDDRTFDQYVKLGYFKEMIIANNIVYDVESICERLGIEDLSEPLLTSEEAAELLGIDNRVVLNLASKGILPCYKFSSKQKKRMYFKKSQLIEHKKLKAEFNYEIINRFYKLTFYKGILLELLEIKSFTSDLSEKELEIMTQYFIDNKTLKIIGKNFGCSKQNICDFLESASNKVLNKIISLKERLNKSKK